MKYADEVLADRSGNCIETTVLFASAIEATGMSPIVVLVPGHAFVGVQPWAWGSGPEAAGPVIVLETTMVGSNTYEEAKTSAIATYNKAAQEGNLRPIVIGMFRKMGITPAAR